MARHIAGDGTVDGRHSPSPGAAATDRLMRTMQYFTPGVPTPDGHAVERRDGRQAEEFSRERWRHDKVVRSTHGVNCTGSCSWN
ncbi:MAG TPA: hypothetical protein VFW74_10205, partial [Acidimicrobiia bacterium]|nr:hypothetical protein [Acidimicrobiia bacterium]